jgi:hypothetical protein
MLHMLLVLTSSSQWLALSRRAMFAARFMILYLRGMALKLLARLLLHSAATLGIDLNC